MKLVYKNNMISDTIGNMSGATSESAGSAGLVPAPLSTDRDKFLKGDGTWSTVVNSTMTGATSESDGASGLVPQPLIADRSKYLKGDGTWGLLANVAISGSYSDLSGTPSVDSSLQANSTNALQNKVISENFADVRTHLIHNIPRITPKDITSYVTDGSLWKRLNGTDGFSLYEDIFVGDYIEMSRAISTPNQDSQYAVTGSKYVTIIGIDSRMGDGDGGGSVSVVNYHHLVMTAGQGFGGTQYFGRNRMNSSNVTTGGYVASELHTTVLGSVVSAGSTTSTATVNQQLYAEFGSHLKTTRELLSNAVDTARYNRFSQASGASSGWAWTSCQAVLMSEVEVYGSIVTSSSLFDTGNACRQFPLFVHSREAQNNRTSYYWLKDVASGSGFAYCNRSGSAYYDDASRASYYVRPRFILA